jgi:nicotinamidase-related amidase
MLSVENTALLAIDFQGKVLNAMYEKEALADSIKKLIEGCLVLGVPTLLTEQYPKGLGPTIPEVSGLLSGQKPVEKLCFNCCDSPEFISELKSLERKQLLVTGIEAHVCVYQSVAALLKLGYEVQVVADGVSSRTERNRDISLEKMRGMGAEITSVEIALFELLKAAGSDRFKEISRIIK